MRTPDGPYVVWEDYGTEGWHPKSYADLTAALNDQRYSSDFVVTKRVQYRVVEEMAVVRSIGPRISQIVMYQDATYGAIPAIITAVNRTSGLVGLTTFPPGAAPDYSHATCPYDYTGSIVGSWHYHETDVI